MEILMKANDFEQTAPIGAENSGSASSTRGRLAAKTAARQRMNVAGLILASGAGLGFFYVKHGAESLGASSPSTHIVSSVAGASSSSKTPGAIQIDEQSDDAKKLAIEFRRLNAVTPVPLTDLKTNPFRAPGARMVAAPILVDSAARTETR
jgi:hypothetical protein